MIYSRFGGCVTVLARCGLHHPEPGSESLLELVRVTIADEDGSNPIERYRYAETLKADGGWLEIQVAVRDAPEVALPFDELQAAKQQAL